MSKPVPQQYARWILASINKHFNDLLAGSNHVHFEGFQRQTDDKQSWFEVRTDGPWFNENTDGRYTVACEVDIAVCNLTDQSYAYKLQDMIGKAANAMRCCIEVRRYGDVADDALNNGTLIFCFELKTDVKTTNFGERPNTSIQQATVVAEYMGNFVLE